MCASSFFFFNDTATTEIYTLSLHDALPISVLLQAWKSSPPERLRPASRQYSGPPRRGPRSANSNRNRRWRRSAPTDRKSTRLNSSHQIISYAVFCLKKKKKIYNSHAQLTLT